MKAEARREVGMDPDRLTVFRPGSLVFGVDVEGDAMGISRVWTWTRLGSIAKFFRGSSDREF